MDKLNELIEFYEMAGDDPELLVMLLELRRHRLDNWKQRAEAAEAKLAQLEGESVLNGWVACSPDWIERNGPCSCETAPRVAFGNIGPHYHPHSFAQANEDYASLKAERDALATENLALKSFIEDECYTLGDGLKYDGLLHAATRSMPITTATNSYANQLRVEGVEMFAAHLRTDKTETSVCKMIALGADEFAANLRKGNGND